MAYKLNIHDMMPAFKAKDHLGHFFSTEDVTGGPIVLYFYPKDNTPGCTKQACSFRDHLTHMDDLDAIVIGISADSCESHESFIEKYGLNFTLLSDPQFHVAKLFDVMKEKEVGGKLVKSIERTTFIIDSQGIIQWIERPVSVDGHVERVIDALHKITHT